MKFEGAQFYHVYNRSFNSQIAFKSDRNYDFFVQKIKSLTDYTDLIAFCIMPNHFHLLIYIPENSTGLTRLTAPSGLTGIQILNRKIGTILSSYTQAFNKQENRTGSLFQPKSKAKHLNSQHSFICFHYIHQNPIKAKLIDELRDWKHSSFQEYASDAEGLCNKKIAYSLLDIPSQKALFLEQSKSVITFEFEE